MKKIIYIIMFGLVMIYSCSLETIPTDKYLENQFWANKDQLNAGLSACYSTLYDDYLYGGLASALYNDVITPNQYMYDNTHGFGLLGQGAHNLSNSSVINERWGACYEGIGRCNTFIDKATDFAMDEGEKSLMVAQAKFLRALYYSVLVDYYGDAPLILESPDLEKQKDLPRTKKSDIVDFITEELEEIAPSLKLSYTTSEGVGRATRGAAYALKARICLYNERWAEAKKACEDVIALNQYAIIDDYRSIFSRENEMNKEVIFDIQALYPDYAEYSFDLIARQYNTHAPLLDLCEAYQMIDGSDYVKGTPLEIGRDPRFYDVIVYPGAQFMGETVTKERFASGRTHCTTKKFSVYDEQFAPLFDWNDINYIVIRYADVILMLAEATNELEGPTTIVYDAVNQIRDRASVNMPTYSALTDAFDKEQMRETIRKERRVELACEGLYYSDIRRWKTAEAVMNGDIYNWYGERIETRVFAAKDYLWPIPNSEIRENKSLLPNNPGWD